MLKTILHEFELIVSCSFPKSRIEEAEAQCALLNSESLCVSIVSTYLSSKSHFFSELFNYQLFMGYLSYWCLLTIMIVDYRMDVSVQIQIYFSLAQGQCTEISASVSRSYDFHIIVRHIFVVIVFSYDLQGVFYRWVRRRWLCCMLWDGRHRKKTWIWTRLIGKLLIDVLKYLRITMLGETIFHCSVLFNANSIKLGLCISLP
jgi:hypothetical protein